MTVTKGDRYKWGALDVTIQRVAKDQTWADIHVQGNLTNWTKRQRLPLPKSFELQETA